VAFTLYISFQVWLFDKARPVGGRGLVFLLTFVTAVASASVSTPARCSVECGMDGRTNAPRSTSTIAKTDDDVRWS
jgi:hypothetical protein